MAWRQKYELGIYDLGGITYTVKFYKTDYPTGDPIQLKGGETPISFEFQNESDDPFDPFRPTQVTLSISVSDENFTLGNDLYSVEEMQVYIEVYEDTESTDRLKFAGWVDPKQYKEPYDVLPYNISIICVDGLSLLSEILYDDNGVYYNGRRLESQILFDIFEKIGWDTSDSTGYQGSVSFKEYCNLYETSMNNTVDDSPFDQIKIDVDIFKDMYCDEVLKEVFKKYNACIKQVNGIFCIYRPKELTGVTVAGRHFTDINIKTSITLTPAQYISRRSSLITTLKQVPGGVKMNLSPAKKVTINQDYGYKESWIDNYQFTAESYGDNGFDFWFPDNAGEEAWYKPIGDYVAGEKEGMAVVNWDEAGFSFLLQDFGVDLVYSATDMLVIEFDYGLFNPTAALVAGVTLPVIFRQNDMFVEDSGDNLNCNWDAVNSDLGLIMDSPVGWSGWISYKRQLLGTDSGDTLRVQLYPAKKDATYPGVYACYKNIKFYTTSYKTLTKQVTRKLRQRITAQWTGGEFSLGLRNKYYSVKYKEVTDNIVEHKYNPICIPIHGINIEKDYLLGDVLKTSIPAADADTNIDNILEQFAGSLMTFVRDSLADAAADFVTNHAGDYSGGGVTVTQGTGIHTNDIIFTSAVPGTDFTGDTTITHATGDLTGTVVNTQENLIISAVAQVNTITVGGNSGSCTYAVGGTNETITLVSTVQAAIDTFITNFGADFISNEAVTLLRTGGTTFTVTANVAGTGFLDLSVPVSGTLHCDIDYTTPNAEATAQARIDTITLSSASSEVGTANILCDEVTEVVAIIETIDYTTTWNSFDDSHTSEAGSKPLLEIIGDEIANQYSRPFQLIQMPIQETGRELSSVNLLGNFQDLLNMTGVGDWFLPSKDELNAMKTELFDHGVGGFQTSVYWESTERDATQAYTLSFSQNLRWYTTKDGVLDIRACRSFTSTTNYNLRDIGPAGGWIFNVIDLGGGGYSYLEAAPTDRIISAWSNVVDVEIGVSAQGTAIGTGQANTTAIINQVGHTDSAAKLCDDLSGNTGTGIPRKFVNNRGSWDVRNRRWNLDLVEIL